MDGKVIIYQTKDGTSSIDVRLEGETVWLTQSQLSELFQTDRTSILRHIKNIYKTDELDENSTCAFFTQVREEGHRTVTRRIPYYNLDMIISVGYRVNSKRGTQFRIWANKVLKEYLVTKNHSFSNGNKRIAATLFLWFMQNNGILYNSDGSKRISNGTLVAITLMIAESRPEEKDIMVKVVVNLINKDN